MSDHAWKTTFGTDLNDSMNLATAGSPHGACHVSSGHALSSVQDNDTVDISSSDGGSINGDITVATGNDFNFFFGSSPLFPTEVV